MTSLAPLTWMAGPQLRLGRKTDPRPVRLPAGTRSSRRALRWHCLCRGRVLRDTVASSEYPRGQQALLGGGLLPSTTLADHAPKLLVRGLNTSHRQVGVFSGLEPSGGLQGSPIAAQPDGFAESGARLCVFTPPAPLRWVIRTPRVAFWRRALSRRMKGGSKVVWRKWSLIV